MGMGFLLDRKRHVPALHTVAIPSAIPEKNEGLLVLLLEK